MHAAVSTQRFSPSADTPPRAFVPSHGLPIDAVLAHVARLVRDPVARRPALRAAADACARLIAARQRLILALDAQQRIEQLAQLAGGRAQARGLPGDESEALRPHLDAVWARASQALSEWREAGQHFTLVTHLLPTQLSPAAVPAQAAGVVPANASAWRMGRGKLCGLAQACLSEFARADAWLAAEARRAGAGGAW